MTFGIPAWLYVDCASEEEAKRYKEKLETLLKSPILEGILRSNGIPSRGVNVLDPQSIK
jgi:hypothetical protein